MPAPTPSPFATPMYPALYLYPLNDSFIPKHISLIGGQRVKIGRQTNAKTVPGERNGYFDSKVLSRQHAEVWEDGGKIFIKDVKSSNGTFINGERLSSEGVESDPYELKSDDIVEFGIDIVGEDNKSIIHHKVAARIVCIYNEQDAQIAARAEQHQQQAQLQAQHPQHGHPGSMQASPSTVSSFNFTGGPSSQRRPPMQQTGLAHNMGVPMRPPGKSGLTFEHILNRLQGELQKSRETGSELHSLTGAMNDIQETLGGTMPPNLPPYPHTLPPVRPSQAETAAENDLPAAAPGTTGISPAPSSLSELQDQLRETQNSLATHIDKIRELEALLKEQQAIKREVSELRELMEGKKSIFYRSDDPRSRQHDNEEVPDSDHDPDFPDSSIDDDVRSINTIVPHELESVPEVEESFSEDEKPSGEFCEVPVSREEDEEEREEERRRRQEELGRPRTPEPNGLGMDRSASLSPAHPQLDEVNGQPSSDRGQISSPVPLFESRGKDSSIIDTLSSSLVSLSNQFESFVSLTASLQAQHDTAQTTISTLQARVLELEGMVQATQNAQEQMAIALEASKSPSKEPEKESLTQMLSEWKKNVEGQWSSVKEEWSQERQRLSKASEEWETKVKHLDSGLATLTSLQAQNFLPPFSNGDIKHGDRKLGGGLVTPPSPRSLSADSGRSRHRRKRSGSSRGRSRSRSPGTNVCEDMLTDSVSAANISQSVESPQPASPVDRRGKITHLGAVSSACHQPGSLITPDSSIHTLDSMQEQESGGGPSRASSIDSEAELIQRKFQHQYLKNPPINPSTAVGVLVLSVAAAAVIWRVKE